MYMRKDMLGLHALVVSHTCMGTFLCHAHQLLELCAACADACQLCSSREAPLTFNWTRPSLSTAAPADARLRASLAAVRCGSYARALQYFETFVRQQHGGGLNPAAFDGGCSR